MEVVGLPAEPLTATALVQRFESVEVDAAGNDLNFALIDSVAQGLQQMACNDDYPIGSAGGFSRTTHAVMRDYLARKARQIFTEQIRAMKSYNSWRHPAMFRHLFGHDAAIHDMHQVRREVRQLTLKHGSDAKINRGSVLSAVQKHDSNIHRA